MSRAASARGRPATVVRWRDSAFLCFPALAETELTRAHHAFFARWHLRRDPSTAPCRDVDVPLGVPRLFVEVPFHHAQGLGEPGITAVHGSKRQGEARAIALGAA